MTDTNAQIARRYFDDVWNRADLAVLDRILDARVVGHVNAATLHGTETLKQRIAALRTIYADVRFGVEDVVAAGDRVAVRWTFEGTHVGPAYGRPASGKKVSVTGMNLFRIADGRIAELWVTADDLGELEQMGVIEVPAGAGT
jgi:steroid delta-isomerase-like uncharacterized protein